MKILLVVYDNASYIHFFPQGVAYIDISDDRFHRCLLKANTALIKNYFNNRARGVIEQARKVYSERDIKFRGFRQY